jgi:hypothetical protein
MPEMIGTCIDAFWSNGLQSIYAWKAEIDLLRPEQ